MALGVALLLAVDVACGDDLVAADEAAPEKREAALAAAALAAENESLRTEIARLSEQVRQLTVSLAEATASLDVMRSGRVADGGVAARSGAGVTALEMQVLDANVDLRMVVVSAGSQDGVRSGMSLVILRDRAVVAKARVVDVRQRISGAVLEEFQAEKPPARDDRVILAR